jgi:hypothetical protein
VSIQARHPGLEALRQQRRGRRLDADDEGENDRSVTAHQNLIAQPNTACQIEFRLKQLNLVD